MSMSDSSGSLRRTRRLRLGAVSRLSSGEPQRTKMTRREELLEIAAELFAARGFVNVTVDDLGAAAGVSGPALYHHFESKEAMLGEMLVDISHHLLEQGRALQASMPADDLLDELVAHHVEFAVDHRALIAVHFRDLFQASDDDQKRVRRLQREYVEIWVDAVLQANGDIQAPVARAAIHAVLGLINSTPYSPRVRRSDLLGLLQVMAEAALAGVADLSDEDEPD